MTPTSRPVTPPADTGASAQYRRRLWALLAAAGAAVGVGAMLGHGLGQTLAAALPQAWQLASGALLGAAVAALLVPASGWLVLRIVAPNLPRRAGLAPVVALKPVKPAKPPLPADAQAPARDALTGAYTQRHFVAAADREWARIRRHGEDAAVLMVDVDHFKRLNQEHTTPCGDQVLIEITRLASATLRPYDLLARFGGGVLVVYLPHTDLLGALDVAERIRERVAGLGLSWQGKRVKATASVGVAAIGSSHSGLDAVLADAGAALRHAKAVGRNCVRAAPIQPKRNPAAARSAGI